jgi:hypothetical protein
MLERFFGGSLVEGEASVLAAPFSFFSLSEETGFAPVRESSSSLFFGDDWREKPETEEEEEDIATEGEGFLVSAARTEEGDEEDRSIGMVK